MYICIFWQICLHICTVIAYETFEPNVKNKYLHFQSKPSMNRYFFQLLIASWITHIWLTTAKLICPCRTLQTSNLFTRSDTGVVIDNWPHLSRTCKTSFLFAPLSVRVDAGCSAFPFYTPTKPLIWLHNNTKLFNCQNYKYIFFYILDIYFKNVNINNKFNFWNVHGIMKT